MSTEFFKSTYSGANQSCVEIAHHEDIVLIRDSKYVGPAEIQPLVTIPAAHWTQFLELALGGNSGQLGELAVTVHKDGEHRSRAPTKFWTTLQTNGMRS